MSTPYIGSKISLISKSEIRYEGILYTVDPVESTIALAKVRTFGTETRTTDHPTPARDEIFEYIIFKATDIKDIVVCETPQPVPQLYDGLPYDPAIVSVSKFKTSGGGGGGGSTVPPGNRSADTGRDSSAQSPQQQQQQHHQGGFIPRGGGGTSSGNRSESFRDGGGAAQSHHHQKQQQHYHHQGGGGGGFVPRGGSGTSSNLSEGGGRNNGAQSQQQQYYQGGGGGFIPRGGGASSTNRSESGHDGPQSHQRQHHHQQQPRYEGDYDFESANSRFAVTLNHLKEEFTHKTKLDDSKEEINEDTGSEDHLAAANVDDEDDEEKKLGYNKTKSFFDNISCESLERMEGAHNRNNWRRERDLNHETFGQIAYRNYQYRRGVGGGRGASYRRGGGYSYGGGGRSSYNRYR